MNKKASKTKSMTIEDLAIIVAKGFENTATRQDLENLKIDFKDLSKDFGNLENKFENLSNSVNNSIEDFTKTVRVDYDSLAGRIKRLEVAVFKR